MSTNNSSSGRIGFAGLLTIVFVVLKLTHVIDWSWVWVLSPAWISIGLGLIVLAIAAGIMIYIKVIDKKSDKKRREAIAARYRSSGLRK